MMASSSRQRSLKNAALPMTGPKDSVSKIPESEYQPKPLAIARPVFNGRPRIKALSPSRRGDRTGRDPPRRRSVPRRLRTICRRLIPLLRNWIPTRNRRKINVYSLASVACCLQKRQSGQTEQKTERDHTAQLQRFPGPWPGARVISPDDADCAMAFYFPATAGRRYYTVK